VSYTLRYHPRVQDRDLPKITADARRRIASAIGTKLVTQPERYGAPLQGTLRGYRKLRVGDHRVIFRIRSKEVWILAIVHRKDAYAEAERRS
jgi:mRNA interferase RelE/StbE